MLKTFPKWIHIMKRTNEEVRILLVDRECDNMTRSESYAITWQHKRLTWKIKPPSTFKSQCFLYLNSSYFGRQIIDFWEVCCFIRAQNLTNVYLISIKVLANSCLSFGYFSYQYICCLSPIKCENMLNLNSSIS